MTQTSAPAPGAALGERPRSRLVGIVDPQTPFSATQETDTYGAVVRGLAEYIAGLRIDAPGGRMVRLKAVREEFSEVEERAVYPSASVFARGDGVYEARNMAPQLDVKERIPPPDGRYLLVFCDLVQDLNVECWCNDIVERGAIATMLERAFNPQPTRYGFVLELPHYFNVRATYSMMGQTRSDDAELAAKRLRIVSFNIQARIPVVSMFTFPDARPSFVLGSIGTGAEALD